MEKPEPVPRPAYNWNKCKDYIEDKYNIKLRDMGDYQNTRKYLDFWHWLLDHEWCEMHNGSYQSIEFCYDEPSKTWSSIWLDELVPDWVAKVYDIIAKEFLADGEACVEFFVEW